MGTGLLRVAVGMGRGRLRKEERDIAAAEREREIARQGRQDERQEMQDILAQAAADMKLGEEGGGIFDITEPSAVPPTGREIGSYTRGGRKYSVRRDASQGKFARRKTAYETHATKHPGELPDFDPTFDIEEFVGQEGQKERELDDAVRDLMGADPTLTKPAARSIARGRPDPRVHGERQATTALANENRRDIIEDRNTRRTDREQKQLLTEAEGYASSVLRNDPKITNEALARAVQANYPALSSGRARGAAAKVLAAKERASRPNTLETLRGILTGVVPDEEDEPDEPGESLAPPRPSPPRAREPQNVQPRSAAPAATPATAGARPPAPSSAARGTQGPVTREEALAMMDAGKTDEEIEAIARKRGKSGW